MDYSFARAQTLKRTLKQVTQQGIDHDPYPEGAVYQQSGNTVTARLFHDQGKGADAGQQCHRHKDQLFHFRPSSFIT